MHTVFEQDINQDDKDLESHYNTYFLPFEIHLFHAKYTTNLFTYLCTE